MGRARDDLDMERALRPRINAPDVVRSTLSHKELKYNESTIDNLLGTPNKILIPERYIPEQVRRYLYITKLSSYFLSNFIYRLTKNYYTYIQYI